jgi:hypothetical protein
MVHNFLVEMAAWLAIVWAATWLRRRERERYSLSSSPDAAATSSSGMVELRREVNK